MPRTTNALRLAAAITLIIPLALGCAKKDDRPTRPTSSRPAPSEGAVPGAAPSTAAAGTASIGGAIKFTGSAPVMGALDMAADPVCAQLHTGPVKNEEVIVNSNGTLSNVIVYVKSGLSGQYDAPSQPAQIDQHGCVYSPHVQAVQAGQNLVILNSDNTLHNVQATPTTNAGFNQAMPREGMKIEHTFTEAEPAPVRFKCQVHPWMTAYMGVFDHPYFAVSGSDGSFSIKNLPAGTYTLAAWHEKYGEKTAEVQVTDGQAATADFSFGS